MISLFFCFSDLPMAAPLSRSFQVTIKKCIAPPGHEGFLKGLLPRMLRPNDSSSHYSIR